MAKGQENTTVAVRKTASETLHKIAKYHNMPLVKFLSLYIYGSLQFTEEEIDSIIKMGKVLEPFIQDNNIEKAFEYLELINKRQENPINWLQ